MSTLERSRATSPSKRGVEVILVQGMESTQTGVHPSPDITRPLIRLNFSLAEICNSFLFFFFLQFL